MKTSQWLKDNDWLAYARKYLPYYEVDDEFINDPEDDDLMEE